MTDQTVPFEHGHEGSQTSDGCRNLMRYALETEVMEPKELGTSV